MSYKAFAHIVVLFGVVLCCVTASLAACGDPTGNGSGVEFRNVSILRALTLLGKQQNVCIAVEGIDKDTLSRTVTATFTDLHADEILRKLFKDDDHVFVSASTDGILYVWGLWAPVVPLLDRIIPVLEAKRPDSLQSLGVLLYMVLAKAVDPTIRGFAGHYRHGDGFDLIGPFVERDRTTRQLLSYLIKKKSTGAMWVVPNMGAHNAMNPSLPFWTLIEYGDPRIDDEEYLSGILPHLAPTKK